MGKEAIWARIRNTVSTMVTKENLKAAGRVVWDVGCVAVPQIRRSFAYLADTGWGICRDVYERRYGSATERIVRFMVLRPILATIGLTRLGWAVVSTASRCGYRRISKGTLPPEDIETLKRCGLIIAGTAAAIYICSDIYDAMGLTDVRAEMDAIGHNGIHLAGLDSVDQLEGVENGMLVDNSPENLDQIIALGELDADMPHSHIPSELEHRDMVMRSVFLDKYGYDRTPEGYEVHHIIPLSEGGADTPDNMILLSEEDHQQVTAAHKDYYGWGK